MVINAQKIEAMLNLQRQTGIQVAIDPYAASAAELLRRPSLFHPILRARFKKQFQSRVQLVLAENAKSLLDEIEKQQNQ